MSLVIPDPKIRYRIVNAEHSAQEYAEVGAASAAVIIDFVRRHSDFCERPISVLDFGCGCARTVQPLHVAMPQWRLFGTDIDAVTVSWSRDHISYAEFAVNEAMPPLRYASQSFEFVYALSVFTHLNAAMQDVWLVELGRVLKPGGLLYLTFNGARVLELKRAAFPEAVVKEYEQRGFAYFANIGDGVLPDWYQTSLQKPEWIISNLPEDLAFVEWKVGGHCGFQDAMLLKKIVP